MTTRRPSPRDTVAVVLAGRVHRFNNLLQAAVGAAELAAVSAPADAEIAKLAEAAAEAARQLVLESRTLFSIAELCWEPRTPTRLGPMLEAAVTGALEGASTAGTIECVEADVLAAPDLLVGAFAELAKNARTAMQDGGALHVAGRTRLLAEGELPPLPAGDHVELRFVDRGPGLPADPSTLFEPQPRDGDRPLTLGLSMVRAIVRQHGGAVWAEATSDGAAFVVVLPTVAALP